MDEMLFKDEDLEGLFEQLGKNQEEVEEELDPEMQAAQRRYEEITKKYKENNV